MAEGEFWLPSDFLSDEDDKTVMSLSSPLDSESDEDDTLAGLTRQMADNILNPPQTADHYPKTMASSPQSTLCPGGIWSGSSNGSPTGASQLSSPPPETPLEQPKGDPAWDIPPPNGGGGGGGGVFVAPGFYSTTAVAHKSQQAERFYHLQQQQLIKQQLSASWGRQQQSRAKSGGAPLGLPLSAWPPLGKQQQQHHHPQPPQSRSGFRAVFLTGSGQRESTGTGVFLPRRPGTPAELRKKPPCSTVLLPDRVIQALNLKLDDIGHHQPRFAVNHVGMVARGGQFPVQQQKQGYYRVAPSIPAAGGGGGGNVEVSLPAEWTY